MMNNYLPGAFICSREIIFQELACIKRGEKSVFPPFVSVRPMNAMYVRDNQPRFQIAMIE